MKRLDVLGNPLPNTEKNHEYTFDTEKDFEFFFDMGIAPEIVLNLSELPPVSRYVITVDDKMLDSYIDDIRNRNGHSVHPETAGEEDMISGEIAETDATEEIVENGIKKNVYITISQLSKEDTKKRFTGLKKDDRIVITADFFKDPAETAKTLGIKDDVANREGITFTLTIKDIYHTDPAGLNEELYKKVYPGSEIITEEQFREQVRTDVAASFETETDKLFYSQVSDTLLHGS